MLGFSLNLSLRVKLKLKNKIFSDKFWISAFPTWSSFSNKSFSSLVAFFAVNLFSVNLTNVKV